MNVAAADEAAVDEIAADEAAADEAETAANPCGDSAAARTGSDCDAGERLALMRIKTSEH